LRRAPLPLPPAKLLRYSRGNATATPAHPERLWTLEQAVDVLTFLGAQETQRGYMNEDRRVSIERGYDLIRRACIDALMFAAVMKAIRGGPAARRITGPARTARPKHRTAARPPRKRR
jgi:hypothetical protein